MRLLIGHMHNHDFLFTVKPCSCMSVFLKTIQKEIFTISIQSFLKMVQYIGIERRKYYLVEETRMVQYLYSASTWWGSSLLYTSSYTQYFCFIFLPIHICLIPFLLLKVTIYSYFLHPVKSSVFQG